MLHYIDDKTNVQERLFEFIPLQSATAESIATALKDRLASILSEDQKSKLICQVYDRASMMKGATSGVQKKIQDVFPNTHYILCYAHKPTLIMQQATSHISRFAYFSFPSHPSGHVTLINWSAIHCQDYTTSDGTFIAVPSILFLSTERISFTVSRAYKKHVTLTTMLSEKQEPWSCYWRIRIRSSSRNFITTSCHM